MKEELFHTRYPNYNVLDKWAFADWDDQTRAVVRKRLEEIPPTDEMNDKFEDIEHEQFGEDSLEDARKTNQRD